jgi:hypothetical protein
MYYWVINSIKVIQAGRVARVREIRNTRISNSKTRKKRPFVLADLCVNWKIIVNWNLKRIRNGGSY